MKRIIIVGVLAAVALLLVYFAILALAQGSSHALEQTVRLWYWLLALAAGFGLQAGLFDFIRRSLRARRAATASVTASGGVSTGSMVACCAHHLSDVLPLLGLSTVAAVLVSYQIFFIVLGVLANAVGITVMLDIIQRHALCPVLAGWRLSMARLKQGTMVLAVIVAALTLLLSFRSQI